MARARAVDRRSSVANEPIAVTARLLRANMSYLSIAYVVGGGVGFVAQATLARHIGGRAYGTYIAAFAIARVASMLNELGSTDYLVREAARDRAWLTRGAGDLLAVKIVVGIGVVIISAGAAAAMNLGSTGVAATVMLALMISADRASDVFRSGLQSIERLDLTCAISVGVSVFSAAGIILAVQQGWGLLGAIAASMAVSILGVPVAAVVLRRLVDLDLRARRAGARQAARDSVAFAVVGFLMFGLSYADTLIVRGFLGEYATGVYGASYRILMVIGFIALALDNSVFRSMSHLAATSREDFLRLVNRATAGLLAVALPFAMGGAVLGDRIVVLVFGSEFADGATVFRILALSLVFSFPRVPMMLALIADGHVRAAAWILGGGFVVNVTVNMAIVPRHGIVAAAWTNVGTEALVTLGAAVALASLGLRLSWLRTTVPAWLAVGLMAIPVVVTRDGALWIPILLGALTYGAIAVGWLSPVFGAPGLRRLYGESAVKG